MNRALILCDPAHYAGHHPMHQVQFAQAFHKTGVPLITLTQAPERLREDLATFAPALLDDIRFERLPPAPAAPSGHYFIRKHRNALSSLRVLAPEVSRVVAKFELDRVGLFTNYLDSYLSPFLSALRMDAFLKYPWAGLFMHPQRVRGTGWKARIIHRWLAADRPIDAKNSRATFVNDFGMIPVLQARHPRACILPMPDFSPVGLERADPIFAQRLKEFQRGRKLVLLPGELSVRKGLKTFLEVARRADDPHVCFAAVGRLFETLLAPGEADRIRAAAAALGDRLFFHPERLAEEDTLNAAIAGCDVVWAAYEGFTHTSNILTKAAAFGRPVLVSRGYCMEEETQKYRLGVAVREGAAEEAWPSLLRLVRGEAPTDPRFEAFSHERSLEKFEEACREAVRRLSLIDGEDGA